MQRKSKVSKSTTKKLSKTSKPDIVEKELPIPTEETNENENNLDDYKIAYVVGLDSKGHFVFQVFGKEKGLVQLMGVHHHATEQIKSAYNSQLNKGDTLTVQVGKLVGANNQKLDKVLELLSKIVPQNSL